MRSSSRLVRGRSAREAATALAFLGALFLLPRTAVSDVRVAFDPPSGIITMVPSGGDCVPGGDILTVRITVDAEAIDFKGFSFVFEFDPLILSMVSVQPGSLLVAGGCANHFFEHLNATAVGDSVAVDGAWLGCSVSGPGAVAEIAFSGLSPGVSPLRWRGITLRDSQNADIASLGQDGQIEVVCPTSVTRDSWGRVRAVYRSAAAEGLPRGESKGMR